MQRFLSMSAASSTRFIRPTTRTSPSLTLKIWRVSFSSTLGSNSGGESDDDGWGGKAKGGGDDLGWDTIPSWSSGVTKDYFDGQIIGLKDSAPFDDSKISWKTASENIEKEELEDDSKSNWKTCSQRAAELEELIDPEIKKCDDDVKEWLMFLERREEMIRRQDGLMKQIINPGVRDTNLKDSEKEEMYRMHKELPEVWTVEKLALEFRVKRQIVDAVLWLKEDEKTAHKSEISIYGAITEETLDEMYPMMHYNDEEFNVSTLRKMPEFQVMPEDWDGVERDPDEVHYEISMREDQFEYEEFVKNFEFNQKRMARQTRLKAMSRTRDPKGYRITVERMGVGGKRGLGGGWKFVSMPDGSTRPLNDVEKMFLRKHKPVRYNKSMLTRLKPSTPTDAFKPEELKASRKKD